MTICYKFTKQSGGRGRPARDSECAICGTKWVEHQSGNSPQPKVGEEADKAPPKRWRSRRRDARIAKMLLAVSGSALTSSPEEWTIENWGESYVLECTRQAPKYKGRN